MRADLDVQMAKAKVQSAATWSGTELVCAAVQQGENTELCGDDHAPVTRGRMRAQYPLPHGPHSPRGERQGRGGAAGGRLQVPQPPAGSPGGHKKGGGGHRPPPKGSGLLFRGGQERPIDPRLTWDGSGGAVAATSAARAGQDPPPGAVTGHQGESLPPSPPQKRAQRAGGGGGWGSRGAPCRPCAMSTGPQHASHARGAGGCGTAAAAITRGTPGCWGEDNGACRSRGGGYSSKRACCPPEGRRSCQPP